MHGRRYPARWVRALMGSLLAAACLLAGAATADAGPPARWGTLGDDIATSWRAQQNPDGTFRDYVYGGDVSFCLQASCKPGLGNARYGESVLGYSLMQTGLRVRDSRLVDSGLRAINYIVGRRDLQRTLPTAFESFSVAAAYNLARQRLPRNPLFTKNRRAWESWLRNVKPRWIGSDRRYFNHHLVEALSNLELFRTGLKSRVSGAVLSRKLRKRQTKLTLDVVNGRVPYAAGKTARTSRGVPGEILSDRPDYPIAYHGFSYGLYARAVALAGRKANARARSVLRRLGNSSWLLAAPDGDVAYTGRSQEEVWSLSSTAYGAEVTSHLTGTSAVQAGRMQALADRTMQRIDSAYGIGPQGLWITPSLSQDLTAGLRGIDAYAGGAAFSGLALMQLEWAIEAARGTRAPTTLAADGDGASAILPGDNATAFVRRGPLWYAIRQASSLNRHEGDLRWDFGLVALKQLRDGAWHDIQPLRPASSGPATSAGPMLLLRTSGEVGIPFGESITVGPDFVTTVNGGFRAPRPSMRWLRRGVQFRYEAVGCGVKLTVPAQPGDSIEYSGFMRGTKDNVAIGDRSVSDGRQIVSYDQPADVSLEEGYSSGSDPSLVRARIVFNVTAPTVIGITTCSA